jgi:hypothetical protein
MGTFAETALVDYRSSLTDHGKQASFSRFRLHQTNRSLPFPFSICAKQNLPFSVSSVSNGKGNGSPSDFPLS